MNQQHINIALGSLRALQDERVVIPATQVEAIAALMGLLRNIANGEAMIAPVAQGMPQDIPKAKKTSNK